MAFLDNSGDIILDAVLTDTGRFRLAKGDGSFKISKFALGDDEIDYTTYNSSHASGSAYYDLEILQTPVLEAFTNNTSLMKSKLLTIARNNILYMPVLLLNEVFSTGAGGTQMNTDKMFLVTVDETTETNATTGAKTAIDQSSEAGVILGFETGGSYIRIDQGLNTAEISSDAALDPDLKETQYIVEIDNRLGSLVSTKGQEATPSFIDDDNVASYYLSLANDADFVENLPTGRSELQAISGPRGTMIQFRILASLELSTSTYLFEQLGAKATYDIKGHSGDLNNSFYYIDTMVRVTGATTGYRIDVPVRFIKRDTSVMPS
tara:strand:+ start:78 stop:1040 length:963 start_codon:yes stop_codon:yes gene_type:complete